MRVGQPSGSGPGKLVVSFSGLDGAGKTYQIASLQAHLLTLGLTCEVLWVPFRIWPEPLLNRLPPRWRRRLGPGRTAPVASANSGDALSRKSPARFSLGLVAEATRRIIWTVIAGIACVSAGLSLRRRVAASSASVVILDRYRLDSIVKLQFWYSEVSRTLIRSLVRWLAPDPDLELLLRVGPAVAWQRKPEQWSLPQLARQAELYDGLARHNEVVVLDGTLAPRVLADEVRCRYEELTRDR